MFPDMPDDDPMIESMLPPMEGPQMYVLTSDDKLYGAKFLADTGKLDEISEKLGCDLVVIPSSIHECIILKLQEYMTRTESLNNQYRKAEAEKLIEKLRHKLQKAKGMDKIFKKYLPKNNARIIVFCSSLDHMMEMMAQIPEWFSGIDCRPHVYQVSSNNPESEDDFISFTSDESEHLKLLYCVDMLNEGIHVSDVDAVVLCRPTTYLAVYKKYRSEGGDRIVPYSYVTEDGVHLGSWCSQIRSQYIRGRLRKDKVQLLKEAGFYFHKFTYTWYMRYEEAKRYYEVNGDINIKQSYIDKYGGKLNKWVKEQKKEYLKERHGNLNKDQIKLLETLHIAGGYKLDARFMKGLNAFKWYIKQNDSVYSSLTVCCIASITVLPVTYIDSAFLPSLNKLSRLKGVGAKLYFEIIETASLLNSSGYGEKIL